MKGYFGLDMGIAYNPNLYFFPFHVYWHCHVLSLDPGDGPSLALTLSSVEVIQDTEAPCHPLYLP